MNNLHPVYLLRYLNKCDLDMKSQKSRQIRSTIHQQDIKVYSDLHYLCKYLFDRLILLNSLKLRLKTQNMLHTV
jgi:hypothetical protein